MSSLAPNILELLTTSDRLWIDPGAQIVRSGSGQVVVPSTGAVIQELLAMGWEIVSGGYGGETILARQPLPEKDEAEPIASKGNTGSDQPIQIWVVDKETSSTPTKVDFNEHGLAAVDQYDSWYIKSPLGKDDTLCMHWKDDFLALDWSQAYNGFVWPKGTRKTERALKNYRHAIGILRLYRRVEGKGFVDLGCPMFITAASLEQHEYPLLLDRLGQLAVSDYGAVVAPIAGPFPTGLAVHGLLVHNPILRQALKLVEFYAVLRTQWGVIAATPAFAMTRSMQKVQVSRRQVASQSGAVIQQSKRPGATHIWMQQLEQNYDSPENRFVAYALRDLQLRSRIVIAGLTDQANTLLKGTPSPPGNEPTAVALWRQGRATAQQAVDYLNDQISRLEGVHLWVQSVKGDRLIAGLRPELPRHPSLRLTRSPGYSTVYSAFRELTDGEGHHATVDTTLFGLMERRVKPVTELYEIWVFLEIYAMLVERFGFQPVNGGPFVHLELQDGRLKLQRGQRYELELRLEGSVHDIYRIALTYEPPDEYPACGPKKRCYLPGLCSPNQLRCWNDTSRRDPLGPDVVMETEFSGVLHRFAIDAKYRRYAVQKPEQKELEKFGYDDKEATDILGHAKQKYLDGKQYDAAFLVHSDPRMTYWGAEPYSIVPWRELKAGLPAFPGHHYGAVFAVPFRTGNLETMLKCLLMYHAEWYDICWICRTRIVPQPGTGLVGKIYQCEFGHDFWVVSHCGNPRHRLIKLGERSFHKTVPGNAWNCVCPECGKKLSPPGLRSNATNIQEDYPF